MAKKVRFPDEPSEKLRQRWDAYGLQHIPLRLLMIAKMLDRTISSAIWRNEGLTLAEWRVVANLARLGESTVGALAEQGLVDPAEVSRAVRRLEARNLVAKSEHPGSRAKKLLSLTEEGTRIAARTSQDRRAYYAWLLDGLDDAQLAMFDDLLLHLAVRIEQHEAGAVGRAATPRARRREALVEPA